MLEKDTIQSRGFRNVVENGQVTGFQFAIRSLYYRDLWLSQIRQAAVTVDGEKFSGSQITWTINGKTYEQAELAQYGNVNWELLKPAILTVRKPGGLTQGYHDVAVNYGYSSSYMPPSMDELISRRSPSSRRLLLV
jgi:hypothetical protein